MKADTIGLLEKFGTAFDEARFWFAKTFRIGMRMAQGAYLLGERRQLFGKLGEEVYRQMQKGELKGADLEPMIKQLDRLTKKVEIEEMLIRNLRFGTTRVGRSISEQPSDTNVAAG